MEARLRRAADRGLTELPWLDSRHSFAFADFRDPVWLGHGPLRVLNDDRLAPGGGFPSHAHRHFEILSFVLDGELLHEDSMGEREILRPGDVQRLSAGRGLVHSEFNASRKRPVHFAQVWLDPGREGPAATAKPSFELASPGWRAASGLMQVAGGDSAISLATDTEIYAGSLESGEAVTHALVGERLGWLQVLSGEFDVAGQRLHAGDGLALAGPGELMLQTPEDAAPGEVLLFDMGSERRTGWDA